MKFTRGNLSTTHGGLFVANADGISPGRFLFRVQNTGKSGLCAQHVKKTIAYEIRNQVINKQLISN